MKRLILLSLFLFAFSFVSAEACSPSVTLLNQDPYPAVPGEYTKLVFQMDGLDNPECGSVELQLLEDFPISFDSNDSGYRKFEKINFLRDYSSSVLVPFKRVRISPNALDGNNPIEMKLKSEGNPEQLILFDLEVKGSAADFEIHVSEYDVPTSQMTLQILNIAKSDIKALTVEIPKQDNIEVKGSNIMIVGDLDSNEYSTADFEAKPKDGTITLKLYYTDSIDVRRKVEQKIEFDSSYFTNKFSDKKDSNMWTYITIIIVLLLVFLFYRRSKKKNKK